MAKLKEIHFDGAAKVSRLNIDPTTAKLVRDVARAERMTLSAFIDAMLRFWVEQKHPQWQRVEDGQIAKKSRRPK